MGDLTTEDIMLLASWLAIPVTDEEVAEVTARYNTIMEAMRQFDDLPWPETEPIPWFADIDWAGKDGDEKAPNR